MNIYRIVEDGAAFCVKALTMTDAVRRCEDSHNEDCADDPEYSESEVRKHYQNQILESCELLGELKN